MIHLGAAVIFQVPSVYKIYLLKCILVKIKCTIHRNKVPSPTRHGNRPSIIEALDGEQTGLAVWKFVSVNPRSAIAFKCGVLMAPISCDRKGANPKKKYLLIARYSDTLVF